MVAVVHRRSCLEEDLEVALQRADKQPAWMLERRHLSKEQFSAIGFPTSDQEEWRFTNLRPLLSGLFRLSETAPKLERENIEKPPLFDLSPERHVFLNGFYQPSLSSSMSLPGVEVKSLRDLWTSSPDLLEPHLARYASSKESFTALNTALFSDGALVKIEEGAVLEHPVHLIFLIKEEHAAVHVHPRVLVLAGEASHAIVVESYFSFESCSSFTNAVTELVVSEAANLSYCTLQLQSKEAFHIANLNVLQQKDSQFSSSTISFGAKLSRHEIKVSLSGEGASTQLNGLYMTEGQQHTDHYTLIDHVKPYTTSMELYKGILDGSSEGVFDGKIIVRSQAQKANAAQKNHNLMLTKEARIHTQPRLEINANDVQCKHGATIGQLDRDALFYLTSRGIARQDATNLLIQAFAEEVLNRIPSETVRARAKALLRARRLKNV